MEVLIGNYELLDFGRDESGEGRKLERVAGRVVDRPSPAASGFRKANHPNWNAVDAKFENGIWQYANEKSLSEERPNSAAWTFGWQSLRLQLKPSPFGHIGLFPEQAVNWSWLQSILGRSLESHNSNERRVLNLFAYTGASTLACSTTAANGNRRIPIAVTHVDASRPAVAWARFNAELSSCTESPIRWIVDDAREYVRKELRRSQKYDLIILDPPSFGHGLKSKRWELDKHLDTLIIDCLDLLNDTPIALLLTGHTPIDSMDRGPLQITTANALRNRFKHFHSDRAYLTTDSGKRLDCGYYFRWFN